MVNSQAMPDPAIDDLLANATTHLQTGRLREAEYGFRQILARDPNHVDALHRLAVLAGVGGQPQAAVDLISRALSFRPDDPNLLDDLAIALSRSGRVKESEGARNRAASIRSDPGPLIAMGDLFRKHRAFDKALDCYRRAAELHPGSAGAHHAVGSQLLQTDHIEPAIQSLHRAAELAPDRAEILRDLGIALLQMQRSEDALHACQGALSINPDDVLALVHLGLAMNGMGRLEEARACFQRAIDLPAHEADEVFSRALALENVDRLSEAIEEYRRAIELDPTSLSAYLNIGAVMERNAQPDEALPWLDKALAMAPNYALTHVNRAVVLLLQGRLQEGWKEYDWRWRCTQRNEAPRIFPQPWWRGEDISGKRVLIHAEQGFGDVIQFVRYAPAVHARGAAVILEVQPELVELVKTLEGVEQVVARNEPLPPFDLHVPMMDLPMIFGTELHTVPAAVPYLHADAGKEREWAQQLSSGEPLGRPLLRVGLAWAGRQNRAFDRTRSMTLDELAPVIEAVGPEVCFISLQKDDASEQLRNSRISHAIRHYGDQLGDFTDTAALLTQLDLLISVDTSVAHLGGALGMPQWILLRRPADWRWLNGRADSPWYPRARLFRQAQRGDWSTVVQHTADELRILVKQRQSLSR